MQSTLRECAPSDPIASLLQSLAELHDGNLADAEALVQTEGMLNLSNLCVLSEAAAEVLSHHGGDLCLNRLSALTEGVARALSKQKGWRLSLDGLSEL